MAGLNSGGQGFAGDDGTADPYVVAVLAAYAAGQESEHAALTALAGARLLVPLVERPPDAGDADAGDADAGEDAGAGQDAAGHPGACDHRAAREMAFPTLIGRDGRPALPAFTSLAALVSWRPEARPVPTPAAQVWGSAVDGSCAVVIDVAGPVPVVVDGARLAALAAGQPPPDPQADPDIRAEVTAALAGAPAIAGADLAAGPDGTDLAVRLLLQPAVAAAAPGADPAQAVHQAVRQAAEAIVARLAGRLRRGIEVSAAPVSGAPGASTASRGPGRRG